MKTIAALILAAGIVAGCKTVEYVDPETGEIKTKQVADPDAIEAGGTAAAALVPPPFNLLVPGAAAVVAGLIRKKQEPKA